MAYQTNMVKKLSPNISENFTLFVSKIIVLPLILFILAVTSGCNSSSKEENVNTAVLVDSTENDLASFQSAKAKWDSLSGQYYTIRTQKFCFCTTEMSAEMSVSVSDNLVLSALDVSSQDVISKSVREEIITVDSLFSLIEKAIADGTSIEVIYNEEYGYPELTKIDLEKLAADGGLHITFSDLELKKSQLELNEVTWFLESFGSIDGPQPIIENTSITLSIDMLNLQLNGSGGCNNYNADFVIDNKNHDITISNVISTEMACTEPENIMQQESSYFATLAQIRFLTFGDGRLNMVVGADAGFHFVTEQPSLLDKNIDSSSTDLVLLKNAKAKWNSLSGQYYTMQSQRLCECLDDVSAQMEISVLDNVVLSATDIVTGEAVPSEIKREIPTVESLFALIEKALADGISIEVTYNEEYGYPETARIDIEQLAVDGGLHINLSNLVIEDSKLALDDVTWVLGSFDSIAGPHPVIENSSVSLTIDMLNLQLTGSGGCNNYTADFVIDNKNHDITISNIVSTEIVCAEPENIMQQETSYFATLAQIRFFTFDDGRLIMVVGGDSGLQFLAAD